MRIFSNIFVVIFLLITISCGSKIFPAFEVVNVDVPDILSKAGWKSVSSCRDLWRQKECQESVDIAVHGVIMLKFNALN